MNFKIFACLMMCSTLSLGSDQYGLSESDLDFLLENFQDSPVVPPPPTAAPLPPPPYALPATATAAALAASAIMNSTPDDEEHGRKLSAKKRPRSKPTKAFQKAPSPEIKDLETDCYSGPILETLEEITDHFGVGPNLKQKPGRPKKGKEIILPQNWIKQVYAATEGNVTLTRGYFGGIHRDKLMSVVDPDFRQARNERQLTNRKLREEAAGTQ